MNFERKSINKNTLRWTIVPQDSSDDNQLRAMFGGLPDISQKFDDGSVFSLVQKIDPDLNRAFISIIIERKKAPDAPLQPTLPARGSPRHERDYVYMNHDQLWEAAKREKVTVHQGEVDERVRERLLASIATV